MLGRLLHTIAISEQWRGCLIECGLKLSAMKITHDDDYRRSMRDEAVRKRREGMLREKHVAPTLTDFVAKLQRERLSKLQERRPGEVCSVEVPDFDPLDGGIHARVLFLLEKPGPMAVKSGNGNRPGSGFISRNNDDPTAEATFNFMHQACIPRRATVIWNFIPWWNGTVDVNKEEREESAEPLQELISLLRPNLQVVVMVGEEAGKARPHLEKTILFPSTNLFTSDHPAALVKARYLDRWNAIPLEWAKAFAALSNCSGSESELCPLLCPFHNE